MFTTVPQPAALPSAGAAILNPAVAPVVPQPAGSPPPAAAAATPPPPPPAAADDDDYGGVK